VGERGHWTGRGWDGGCMESIKGIEVSDYGGRLKEVII
jgi:hypothetical protein